MDHLSFKTLSGTLALKDYSDTKFKIYPNTLSFKNYSHNLSFKAYSDTLSLRTTRYLKS